MVIPKVFVKTITVADGGVATEVDMGFVPDWCEVKNRNAATTEIQTWKWGAGMGDAKGWKTTMNTTDGDMTAWVASGGDISKLDEATIDPGTANDDSDPTRIVGKQGIIIAAGFHDTSDVIDIVAFRSDLGD